MERKGGDKARKKREKRSTKKVGFFPKKQPHRKLNLCYDRAEKHDDSIHVGKEKMMVQRKTEMVT